jgi:hypothetical protein
MNAPRAGGKVNSGNTACKGARPMNGNRLPGITP